MVAEILQGETQVYYDSFDWSLPADTDDTVSFAAFEPPDTGTYTLHIYTVMEPDESDADDEKTKELHFTAIAEPIIPITFLDLKVSPLSRGDVHVSYSLPNGHEGILILFDASGRRVDARQVRGYGAVEFDSELAVGVYIVKLEASGATLSRKVIIVE
ncbi:T9SS type A sorting domain-containing protein [candidate division WOR-3 bacterium]|nr:T9SS type A sorting domain-containing protein [candidate division WOR-3 bacterium]